MGQAAVPIILAVAAAGTSAYNTSRTAKKQDSALAAGLRKQGALDRRAAAKTSDTLGFFEESGPDEIRADLSDKYRKQIRLKQGTAFQNFEDDFGASEAFDKAKAKGVGTSNEYAGLLEGLFSSVDAAGEQRRLEAFEQGDLGKDLSILGRESGAERFITDLNVSGIQRSVLLDLISAGLSGASGGLSGGIGAAAGGIGSIAGKTPNVPTSITNPTPTWYTNPLGIPNVQSPYLAPRGIPYKI